MAVRHWEVPGYRDRALGERLRLEVTSAGMFLLSGACARCLLWMGAGILALFDLKLMFDVRSRMFDACYALPQLAALPVIARSRRALILCRIARGRRSARLAEGGVRCLDSAAGSVKMPDASERN